MIALSFNTTRLNSIVILCILCMAMLLLMLPRSILHAQQPSIDAAKSSEQQSTVEELQILHITPATLEGQEVYPTRHALVPLDPFYSYRWGDLEVPAEWMTGEYYFELWDAKNRPIPEFSAQPLRENGETINGNTISLESIDATVYPMVRIVLFAQEGATPIPAAAHTLHITYTESPNTLLAVFTGLLTLMIIVSVCSVAYWKVSLLGTVMGSLPIVSTVAGSKTEKVVQYMLIAAVWSSAFGAVVGLYVGGIQIVYLLIKLPFLLLVTFVFSFASSTVLSLLLGIRASVQELLAQSLRVLATFSVSLASLSTLIIFYILAGYSHDQLLTAFMFTVSISALFAALQLWNWIRKRAPGIRGIAVAAVWLGLYGVVLLQFGWMLRPWVGTTDPIHGSVPFARLDSGSVFEEVVHTLERL